MRFLALALYIVAAVSHCQAEDVEELKKSADEAGAPFTEVALKRLEDNALWGAKRHSRSSDISIINASKQTFSLHQSDCREGIFSDGLLPEIKLHSKTSTVFGIESSRYLQGIQCTIKYESTEDNNSWIDMVIHTPFYGNNEVFDATSWDLSITHVVGVESNNQIQFIVTDKQFTDSSTIIHDD